MAGRVQYQKVIKYLVTAECTEPLHIGSSSGEKEEVLIHPVENVPFLPASGIAGVFRSFYEKLYGCEDAGALFGSLKANEAGEEQESRVRFSDGTFRNPVLERRPRVAINKKTGTCDSSSIQGTDNVAGHRFTMEYLGAGTKVEFAVYLYDETQAEQLETIFSAMHQGALQLGGQKSNGCGCLSVDKLYRFGFALTDSEGRKNWADEDDLSLEKYEDLTECICNKQVATGQYEITVCGKTENMLLVKSMAASLSEDGTSYSENVKNAKNDYIVPGSSLKGAIRSQMERIAKYLSKESMIETAFGKKGSPDDKGSAGCLYFHDAVIGNQKDNAKAALSHRIHIDKFTGGVFNGGLFSERNVFGKAELRISVKKREGVEAVCGLLLMALRDLAIGSMSIGGGFSIGKGFFEISELTIRTSGEIAKIDFTSGTITDESSIVSCWMKAVNGTEEKHGV